MNGLECDLQVLYYLHFLASSILGTICELQCLYLHLLASSIVCFDAKSPSFFHNHLGHLNLTLFFKFCEYLHLGGVVQAILKFNVQVFFNIIFCFVLFLFIKIYVTILSFGSFNLRGSVRIMILFILGNYLKLIIIN